MKVTINYKNGNTLTEEVHYIHTEEGRLYYTVKKNPMPAVQVPVWIPLENIESFTVIPEEV